MEPQRHLGVELTDRCNLRCEHCPSGRHSGRGELSLAVFERIVQEAHDCGIHFISFTGGEPLLYRAFDEIIARTATAGYDYGFVTNGWYFAKRIKTLLAYRDRLRMVGFSIDGATEQTHDQQRGAGSFRRLMQAISLCVIRELPFTLNVSITRHNYPEMQALVDLARQLGAQGIRFSQLLINPRTTAHHLEFSPEEQRIIDEELRVLKQRNDFPVIRGVTSYTEELFSCQVLQGQEFYVDWAGNLSLCCNLSGFGDQGEVSALGGNLQTLSLAEGLKKIHHIRETFIRHKQHHHDHGDWSSTDYFPCWYCARHFLDTTWLQQQPDHPWHQTLTQEAAASI